MPDYKEVNKQREMAGILLESMSKMDLGIEVAKGISIPDGVANVGLDAITFIWQENIMKDRDLRFSFFDHMDEYPEGYLVQMIRCVADQWVEIKKINRKKVYEDFGLLE